MLKSQNFSQVVDSVSKRSFDRAWKLEMKNAFGKLPPKMFLFGLYSKMWVGGCQNSHDVSMAYLTILEIQIFHDFF